MPRRMSKQQNPIQIIASQIIEAATTPPPTSPTHMALNLASAALGRIGGVKDEPVRPKRVSAKKPVQGAKKTAQARRTKKPTKAQ